MFKRTPVVQYVDTLGLEHTATVESESYSKRPLFVIAGYIPGPHGFNSLIVGTITEGFDLTSPVFATAFRISIMRSLEFRDRPATAIRDPKTKALSKPTPFMGQPPTATVSVRTSAPLLDNSEICQPCYWLNFATRLLPPSNPIVWQPLDRKRAEDFAIAG